MRRGARIVRAALAAGVVAGAAAMAGGQPVADAGALHATGAEPPDLAAYARLPKLQRHRAWLPRSVDLADRFPEPGQQGASFNCVSWAVGYSARSYLYGEQLDRKPAGPSELVSPAYLYNRLRPPGSLCVVSTSLTSALDMMKTEGSVTLADYPDDLSKCRIPAPDDLKAKASQFRISDWRAVDREVPDDWRSSLVLDDVKAALARKVPVVFTMPTAYDFQQWKGGGVYQHQGTETRGWHAMALVGYDEDRQAFKLINSWGKRWGDGGFAWIGYDTFRRYAGEAYAIEAPTPADAHAPRLSRAETLDKLAAGFPCGQAKVSREDGHLVVTGFGGEQNALGVLKDAALAVDAKSDFQVAYHPWPQCEAQLTLANQLAAGGVTLAAETDAGVARAGDPIEMKAGERFGIQAATSRDRPYLHIVYLQADGSAVELYRGAPAGGRIELGTGAGQARFEVAPPYGNEVLVALAAAQPLFGDEMAGYRTERQFLTGLRARLAGLPPGTVSAAVLRLRTHS